MGKELHCGLFVGSIVWLAEFGADVVCSGNSRVVEQRLFSKVGPDVCKVLGERGGIEVGLKGGNVENSISRRDVNRDGDVDTLLCQRRTSDERSNEEE